MNLFILIVLWPLSIWNVAVILEWSGISLQSSTLSGREKRKGPMISAGDAEYPRDYHTLAAGGGRGARRFTDGTNGGFTSSSLDRRHNSVAAKSLEALNSIHKADIERQRDALMDLQKNKFSNSPGGLSQGSATAGRQVSSHAWLLISRDTTSCISYAEYFST